LVKVAQVSRHKPAIFEGLLCLLWLLIIALHHINTPYKHLSLFGYLYINLLYGKAYRAKLGPLGWVKRDYGRGLCKAIALKDGKSKPV